ncbi:MAG: hypothetical protein AB1633_01780 [Elusimicrobiota bacterium]
MGRFSKQLVVWFFAAVWLCLILPAAGNSAGTVANTVIQNGGDAGTSNTADTAGDTVVQWVIGATTNYATCSSVSVTVSTGYGIAALPTPSDQTSVLPGATVYYAYYAYNVGNATDTFTLVASTFAGRGWSVKLYKDDNSDGVHQTGETTEVSNTGQLIQETTYYFHVAVVLPTDAADGTSTYVRLTVKDQNGAGTEDNWQTAGNDTRQDEATTVCSAVTLQVVKGRSVATARPFTDTVIYTTTITATGTESANNVVYKDKIPATVDFSVNGYGSGLGMTYCIWSPSFSSGTLTNASDSDKGTWDSGNQLVTINLGNLTAGASAYVEFKVTVK